MGVTRRERGLELLADGRPRFRGLRALRRADHRAAAIGAAEGLVHGHDIATGLGLAWSPSPQVCGQVLSTVFPDAGHRAGSTALTDLLIRTGRDERPKDEPPRVWSYSAAAARPLGSDA